jgi:RNA polymerase sigma-70 factor (ECF subfamily)
VSSTHASGLDQQAFDGLYQRLERPLYNVVYRRLWHVQDSHDVVQEAFVRLWGMRARVRQATVEPLVWRIALNLASTRARRRRLWGWWSRGDDDLAELADTTAEADAQLADHERVLHVRAAVEALPEKLRDVVMLCEFSGLSYAEVGAVLGIPAGTVGSRRHAGLAALRRHPTLRRLGRTDVP